MPRDYSAICKSLESRNRSKAFEEGLCEYDFPDCMSPYRHLWLIVGLFFFPSALITLYALSYVGTATFDDYFKIVTALCATGGLVLTMLQWITARREASLDKYYDRLEYANKRLEPFADHLKMYVYMELDNLEYVIEKYKLGFISHQQAFRGLHAFIRHAIASEHKHDGPDSFIDHMRNAVGNSGYHHTTKVVINEILKQLDKAPVRSKMDMPGAGSNGEVKHAVMHFTD